MAIDQGGKEARNKGVVGHDGKGNKHAQKLEGSGKSRPQKIRNHHLPFMSASEEESLEAQEAPYRQPSVGWSASKPWGGSGVDLRPRVYELIHSNTEMSASVYDNVQVNKGQTKLSLQTNVSNTQLQRPFDETCRQGEHLACEKVFYPILERKQDISICKEKGAVTEDILERSKRIIQANRKRLNALNRRSYKKNEKQGLREILLGRLTGVSGLSSTNDVAQESAKPAIDELKVLERDVEGDDRPSSGSSFGSISPLSPLSQKTKEKMLKHRQDHSIRWDAFYNGHDAAQRIQSYWRGFVARQKYAAKLGNIVSIQNVNPKHASRKDAALNSSDVCSQQHCLGYREYSSYSYQLHVLVLIQAAIRGYLCRHQASISLRAARTIQRQWRAFITRRKYMAAVRSIVMIQSAVRGHASRKNAELQSSAAVCIQRHYLGYRERRCCTHQLQALVLIQAAIRGYLCRHQASNNCRPARKILSQWRAFISRRKYTASVRSIVMIQNVVRGHANRKNAQLQRRSAVCIKHHYLGYRERRCWTNQLPALILIQAAVRGYLCRHQTSISFGAARMIQSQWRAFIARRKYKIALCSIVIIQSVVRGHASRKNAQLQHTAAVCIKHHYLGYRERRCYRHQLQALVLIQAAIRGYLCRHQVCISCGSARTIQSKWRAFFTRHKYTASVRSILMIQNVVRGHASRMNAELDSSSALCIQRHYLGYRGRRCCTHQLHTLVLIQAAIRGHLCRHQASISFGAARTIQRQWRAFISSRKYMARSIVIIQSVNRGHAGRKVAGLSCHSSFGIQRRYLGYRERLFYMWQLRFLVLVQAATRSYIVRQRVRKRSEAARVILSQCRTSIARKRYTVAIGSVVIIQSVVRGHASRKDAKLQSSAAVSIQRHYLGYRERWSYRHQLSSAIMIQSAFRRHLHWHRVRNNEAAMLVQSHWRGVVARRKYLAFVGLIVLVQSSIRGRACRKVVESYCTAAMCIQRHYLEYLQRCSYRCQLCSAVMIQATFRGHLVRHRARVDTKAACLIQSHWRGFIDNKNYAAKQSASVKFQAMARVHIARKQYIYTVRSIILIQSVMRAYLCWNHTLIKKFYSKPRRSRLLRQAKCRQISRSSLKKFWKGFSTGRRQSLMAPSSIVLTQKSTRGQISRSMAMLQLQSATCTQREYRGHQECRSYGHLLLSTGVVQMAVRSHLVQLQVRIGAAQVIQRHWRGAMARRDYGVKRSACIKIQAVLRCCLAANHYFDLLWSSILVQSAVRGYICRKQCLPPPKLQTTSCSLDSIRFI